MIEFKEFPKIARLNRDVIITEKIDGTNACVVISDDGLEIVAQSRSQIITPQADNFGFAKWVEENRAELLKLGPGHHFGEWWGAGIQRRYGLTEKRFSLFNVERWTLGDRPSCCYVVPVLASCNAFEAVAASLEMLRVNGSYAAPGFMKPEGIVAYHKQGHLSFKVTLEKDAEWKGKQSAQR